MSDAFKERQNQMMIDQAGEVDIIITTALIPNRPAPKLVSKEMLAMIVASLHVPLVSQRSLISRGCGGCAKIAAAIARRFAVTSARCLQCSE